MSFTGFGNEGASSNHAHPWTGALAPPSSSKRRRSCSPSDSENDSDYAPLPPHPLSTSLFKAPSKKKKSSRPAVDISAVMQTLLQAIQKQQQPPQSSDSSEEDLDDEVFEEAPLPPRWRHGPLLLWQWGSTFGSRSPFSNPLGSRSRPFSARRGLLPRPPLPPFPSSQPEARYVQPRRHPGCSSSHPSSSATATPERVDQAIPYVDNASPLQTPWDAGRYLQRTGRRIFAMLHSGGRTLQHRSFSR